MTQQRLGSGKKFITVWKFIAVSNVEPVISINVLDSFIASASEIPNNRFCLPNATKFSVVAKFTSPNASPNA